MNISEFIAIISIILVNAGSIIAYALKTNGIIASLNQRVKNVETRLNEEISLTRENLDRVNTKLDAINDIMTAIRLDVQSFKHVAEEHERMKNIHIK